MDKPIASPAPQLSQKAASPVVGNHVSSSSSSSSSPPLSLPHVRPPNPAKCVDVLTEERRQHSAFRVHQERGAEISPSSGSQEEQGSVGVGRKRSQAQVPMVRLLVSLVETYQQCDPNFKYSAEKNPRRVLTEPSTPVHNHGYDNVNYDYILVVNDVIVNPHGRQYTILDSLGSGTFGQVVKVLDSATGKEMAVKVIKNRTAYFTQARVEVDILHKLNNVYDPEDKRRIVRMHESFTFRNHLCLVFELLWMNLFDVIKENNYKGFSTNLVRIMLRQLLQCAKVLEKAKIIHCDMKPENILLQKASSPDIKVIDFGSACFEGMTVYTYIQSRFYRSPEVILGLPYTGKIDVWSLGCIAAELFLGLPLFPGQSEYDQIKRIVDMLGLPPTDMLEQGKNTAKFFNRQSFQDQVVYDFKTPDQFIMEQGTRVMYGKQYFRYDKLEDIVKYCPVKASVNFDADKETADRQSFLHFLRGLLNLDPTRRWTCWQASKHPFVGNNPFDPDWTPPEDPRVAEVKRSAQQRMLQQAQGPPAAFGMSPQVDSCMSLYKDYPIKTLSGMEIPGGFLSEPVDTPQKSIQGTLPEASSLSQTPSHMGSYMALARRSQEASPSNNRS